MHLARLSAMPRETVRALVLLVSPFAPHVADGIAARLAGQAVRKFVYVPGQVVNLVVG